MPFRVDPVKYATQWAEAMPVVTPSKGDVVAARRALAAHATLLYSSPLAQALKPRRRDMLIREQLLAYSDLLDCYGFIETQRKLKSMAVKFLRGFEDRDGSLFYEPVEDICYTPVYRVEQMLVGRPIIMSNGDAAIIQFILSWLLHLSKVPLDRPDLKAPAQKAWVERQDNPIPRTAPMHDIEALRAIIGWLVQVEPGFVGNHGPGKTSVSSEFVPDKNENYRPNWQTCQLIAFHPVDVDFDLDALLSPVKRPAVWVDVPKDIGSVRPITKEPPEMQFAQQALKYDLYRAVDQGEVPASNFIKFSDQTFSQECAIRGSCLIKDPYKPSTIDLNFSSDYLSVDLVCDLFSGNLLHLLLAGRSHEVLVKKMIVELSMYGGMGSALTFPVQTFVFCAAAIWSVIRTHTFVETGVTATIDDIPHYLDYYGFKNRFRRMGRSIRIYGDDIAVPDFAAQDLIELLQSLGLKVNVDKSFIGISPVRESCGVYALGGCDITPKRYTWPPFVTTLDGASYEAIRSYANEAFHMGWKYSYRFAVRQARDTTKFMSSDQMNRKTLKGAGKCFSASRQYPDQPLAEPKILFELDSGRRDYIGFISDRPSTSEFWLDLWESKRAFTTFFVETPADKDDTSDYYHLTVNYRLMRDRYVSSNSHGRIPAGTRLVKRNAIHRMPHPVYHSMVWGWAPR